MHRTIRAAYLAALAVAAIAPVLLAQAPQFTLDRNHTQIMFRARHMGVANVTGQFREFEGSFVLDTVTLANASAQITIRTASVDTENERRDNHLRSPDFFAADSFPEITFRSTRVERGSGPGIYRMTGDLTMRGVTRPVTLDVEMTGTRAITGQQGRQYVAGFMLTGRVNRFDYGLRWNNMIEGVGVVGEEIRITIEAEARAPAPAT
jgi:polyisoprenoid-binding protein YceI